MKVDDINSYTVNTHSYNVYDPFDYLFPGNSYQLVWNYGIEIFCNKEGRYTHIVADLSHLTGQTYSMSICALGIMGTRYIRSNALPTSLEVTEGTVTTLNVQQIVSEYDIGNVLEVNLAAPTLSFVQIVM